jgi:heat shock protein HslJ
MQRFAGIGLLMIMLTACARPGLGAGGATNGPSKTPPDVLGSWVLQHGSGASGPITVPDGSEVTITFDGERVSGRACNLYGGEYKLAEDGTLTISAIGMTEMACEEPMMTLEADFHAALAMVRRASVIGDSLTLSGEGAELVFARLPKVPDAELVGTHWTLTTLFQGDTASSVYGKGWLQLDANGTLSGSTGCRGFNASYSVSGDRLRISNLINEDPACEGGPGTQDDLALAVLGSGHATFSIAGQQLTLSGSDGQGLGYTAATE